MRRYIFEFGKFAILLQEHAKVLADRVDRPATVCGFATISDERLISEVALLPRPLIEESNTSSSPVISCTKYRRCA